jgi:ribosomal protein L22
MERQVSEQGFQKKQVSENKPKQNLNQNIPVKEEKKEINQETKEQKVEEKKTETKPVTQPKIKKEFVIVQGKDLPLSYKTSGAVCRFIKNKNPQKAIELLELVIKKKIAVPYRGESAHKKNQRNGYARAQYPEKTSGYFIKLLKSLIANAKTSNMDTEKIIITIAKANKAAVPMRGTRMGFGRKKFKRAHIFLEAREKSENMDKKAKSKTQNTNKKLIKSHMDNKNQI